MVSNIERTLLPQGAALGSMVGLLTFGNRKFEALDSVMRAAIQPLHAATQSMLSSVDKDTQAFSDYMASSYSPPHIPVAFSFCFVFNVGCSQTTEEQ